MKWLIWSYRRKTGKNSAHRDQFELLYRNLFDCIFMKNKYYGCEDILC